MKTTSMNTKTTIIAGVLVITLSECIVTAIIASVSPILGIWPIYMLTNHVVICTLQPVGRELEGACLL